MKKVLSLLLAAVLLAGSLPMAFAASVVSESVVEQVIRSTGIMVGDTNGNMNLDKTVTRAEYAKMLGGLNYTDYNSGTQEEQDESEEEIEVVKKETSSNEKKYPAPYVISPEEFGANEEYDIITFRYYSDHILADEDGQLIEDVEGCIGFESLNHFGEYEEDSVFVRNERLKTDFEILRDLGTYADVIKSKPYLRR